jgi:hypothetical protein
MTEPTVSAETECASGSTVSAQNLRPWPKGVSGNPSGRRKEEGPVRELARRYTVRAIRRLAQLMQSRNERVAVIAAQALLDRGWGRPAQALTGADGGPLGLVVGLMSAGPITDAQTAAQTYLAIMGNPSIDLGSIVFEPPVVAPAPVEEAPPQAVEFEPPLPHSAAAEPGTGHYVVPDDGNVIRMWERLSK